MITDAKDMSENEVMWDGVGNDLVDDACSSANEDLSFSH